VAESIGVTSGDGMSVSIQLETAPDVLEPDRLAVRVRIPLDAIRALTPSPQDYVVSLTPTSAPERRDSE